jgi:regulator of replication initiation timing
MLLFQIEAKLEDIENNNSQLGDLKKQLTSLIQECEQLYSAYEERRNKASNVILTDRIRWLIFCRKEGSNLGGILKLI